MRLSLGLFSLLGVASTAHTPTSAPSPCLPLPQSEILRREMSQQNVELHRRSTALFNARDIEGTIALSHPDIELHAMPAPRGGVYRGHDGLRAWHRDLEEAWGEIRVEPEAYFDLGERTAGFFVLHARGEQSGADVTMRSASVVQWRDGLAVYTKVFADWGDALAELDISSDALEEIAP